MSASSTQNQKTLFVVGAGASSEVKLPIGSALAGSIASALNFIVSRRDVISGDDLIYQALCDEVKNNSSANIGTLIQASQRIRDAMPQAISIDNFIDQHSDDKQIELCGKLAIVREILKKERSSLLFVNPSNSYNKMNFEPLKETWFASFWKLLTENCEAKDLEQRFNKIAFVIFNYDRCIEQYLYCSLQNSYRIDAQAAARLVKSIEIYHPYGTVGSLPWQGIDNPIVYGDEPTTNQLLEIAKQVRTFTEVTVNESSEVSSIRTHMMTSPRIVFLGFAFHRLNVKLLAPLREPTSKLEYRHIYASTHGLSEDDIYLIADELKGRDALTIFKTKNVLCNKLFYEFWRSLSFV